MQKDTGIYIHSFSGAHKNMLMPPFVRAQLYLGWLSAHLFFTISLMSLTHFHPLWEIFIAY